jgi:DNA-directed RNA polymerase specialized sigma24 family protein
MLHDNDGSVTGWIEQLKAGDVDAAARLWERYFDRLVRLARDRLSGPARRLLDEEDVALSAFDSFCQATVKGRFPGLEDRDELWQLLVVITARKAADQVNRERRQKRGGGAVLDEAGLSSQTPPDADVRGLDGFLDRAPPPELEALVAEEFRHLLDRLGDDTLRALVLWRMEGYTEAEMAERLGSAGRTVRRKLALIRRILAREAEG